MAKMTTAYHGSADITADNAASILNNLLPEDPPKGEGIGLVIVPASVPRFRKGLKTVIAWLEGEVGKDGTIPADDVLYELLTRAEYKDDDGNPQFDDLVLVMLYDETNEDDVALAQKAHDVGIRVVNLAAAGDDLLFEDPEPETPAEEEPPFDGGTSVAGKTDLGQSNNIQETIARATSAGVAAAAAQEAAGAVGPEGRLIPGQGVSVTLSLSQDAIDLIAAAIVRSMAKDGGSASTPGAGLATITQPPAGATVHQLHPDDGGEIDAADEQAPGTTPYYYHEDTCKYRPARGRAKAGETKVFLTDEGIRQVTQRKLLA